MDVSSLWNVTPESLVKWAGLGEDDVDRPDSARLFGLKSQLGIMQSRPLSIQMKMYSEVAAKYLPALVDIFRQRPEPISPVGMLINTISASPYFVRFLRSPAAEGIAALQAKRIANSASEITMMSVDDVGEIGQFLATLLLLQGVQDVADEDKAILLQHFPTWERKFSGRLASETAGRCLALLTADPRMRPMMQGVKDILESKLEQCGGPGCVRRVQKDGSELSQCGRCKTAVYCGVEHQKAAWATHKPTCFAPTF
ncbi:hypothetical protein C8F04DRAFT_1045389 [Mycena alexandri]|uniref:MYND-type domain-containing protein n=1 Tax=Mycena alexandri TaxID=1745969 RepID=A0AAD6SIH5_9AGAR|nr:hypothetical protein C8F04DRAFT_1045389 [Mycena alexandri]